MKIRTRHVPCVWYDETDERRKAVLDQRTLFKLESDHGLYTVKD